MITIHLGKITGKFVMNVLNFNQFRVCKCTVSAFADTCIINSRNLSKTGFRNKIPWTWTWDLTITSLKNAKYCQAFEASIIRSNLCCWLLYFVERKLRNEFYSAWAVSNKMFNICGSRSRSIMVIGRKVRRVFLTRWNYPMPAERWWWH